MSSPSMSWLDLSEREARAEFDAFRAGASKGRHSRAGRQERAGLAGLPSDFATRHALDELAARAGDRAPRRVVSDWANVDAAPVAAVGYDTDSRRLAVRLVDGHVEAFRGVPPALAAEVSDPAVVGRA